MSALAGKLVFWVGAVLWTALFLAITLNAHRDVFDDVAIVGRMDGAVANGRLVYERHHCGACHTVLGVGASYAPDLTRAWQRMGELAMRARLANGDGDDLGRKMPQKPLAAGEIDDVVRYLGWVARVEAREWPDKYAPERIAAALRRVAPSPEPGAVLVADYGCLDCHAIGDRGHHRAPRLEDIAARDDAAYVREYLANPAQFAPGTAMPPFATIPRAERYAMGQFVAGLTR